MKNKLNLKIYCDFGAVKISFDDPIKEGNYYEITTDTETEAFEKNIKLKLLLPQQILRDLSPPSQINLMINQILKEVLKYKKFLIPVMRVQKKINGFLYEEKLNNI